MTREEQINEAVETYINGLFEDGIEIPIEDYENIGEGFVAGAKWADKHPNLESLWHDASEEPVGANWEILCQDEMNGCWVENRIEAQLLHKNWNAYTEIEKIVRWAYISDLLPKGGEK